MVDFGRMKTMPSVLVLAAAAAFARGDALERTFSGAGATATVRVEPGEVDPAAELERFWDANMPRIQRWYLARRRPDDVVVTASPADFVRPACVRLGVGCVLGAVALLAWLAGFKESPQALRFIHIAPNAVLAAAAPYAGPEGEGR